MSDTILNTKWTSEDDKVIVSRSQDVTSILDFNREKQIDGHNVKSGMRHVAGIPFIVVEKWLMDSGLRFGSPEFNEYIKKEIISGDYSKLLVHGY